MSPGGNGASPSQADAFNAAVNGGAAAPGGQGAQPGVGSPASPAPASAQETTLIQELIAALEQQFHVSGSAAASGASPGAGAQPSPGAAGGTQHLVADLQQLLSGMQSGASAAQMAPLANQLIPELEQQLAPSSGASLAPPAASPSGQTVSIDGGSAVTQRIVNNTGHEQKFAFLENGQVKGLLDLQAGQSGNFTYDNAPSARIEEATASGAVLPDEALDELNTTDGKTSADVSKIDSPSGAGGKPVNITITDGAGKSVGDGALGGDYWHPNDDQSRDPATNPMSMTLDPSRVYTNTFS